MKRQINPKIKAHLLRGGLYLLLLLAVGVIPFALAQRATSKQSAGAAPRLLGSTPVTTLLKSDNPADGLGLTRAISTPDAIFTPRHCCPTARSWSQVEMIAVASRRALPNGMVLVAGGSNNSDGYVASAELYDLASGSWTTTGNLNTGRYYHTATLLPNGKVIVAGGIDSSGASASAEVYDPASGVWTTTGSLNTARYNHTASLLPNGMVLVAGGYDSNG